MPLRRKLAWIAILSFASGLPNGLVNQTINNYFSRMQVSLPEIGLISILGAAWSYKVFWAPVVDRVGTIKGWLAACLLLLAVSVAAIPLFPGKELAVGLPMGLLFLIAFVAFLSATQDVAIDGYTIGLLDKGEEGPANSIRVAAYRVALIVAGGALVTLAGGGLLLGFRVPAVGWSGAFFAGAGLLAACAIVVPFLPRPDRAPSPPGQWMKSLLPWVKTPKGLVLLAFVFLYKIGDYAMAPMVTPFWVQSGMSDAQIGLFKTTLGMVATVLGAVAGGWLIARKGIHWGLWVLGLFQAFSNLGYFVVARLDLGWHASGGAWIYGAGFLESASAGLGVAAFLSFLMNLCDKEHAVTQYALLTAVMAQGGVIAGGLSGYVAERLSFEAFFYATFVIALPAFLLIPRVKGWIREGKPAGAAP
ncbi:MAG: MFS transporter [Planctomycetota bacterium]